MRTVDEHGNPVCRLCGRRMTKQTRDPHGTENHARCVAKSRQHTSEATPAGRPGHWNYSDARIIERDSPEGQAILQQRAERAAATAIREGDRELAAMLSGVR